MISGERPVPVKAIFGGVTPKQALAIITETINQPNRTVVCLWENRKGRKPDEISWAIPYYLKSDPKLQKGLDFLVEDMQQADGVIVQKFPTASLPHVRQRPGVELQRGAR